MLANFEVVESVIFCVLKTIRMLTIMLKTTDLLSFQQIAVK